MATVMHPPPLTTTTTRERGREGDEKARGEASVTLPSFATCCHNSTFVAVRLQLLLIVAAVAAVANDRWC